MVTCTRREIEPHLHDGHDLPVVRERGIQASERIGDAAPLFHGNAARVATVDDVPDERPDYPDPALGSHAECQTPPRYCCLKLATAPTTPALPGNSPATIRTVLTAGLNARRFTSARSGTNSASPAAVT